MRARVARPEFWYTAPKGEAHTWLFDYVRGLEQGQRSRHEMNVRYAQLYAPEDNFGVTWTTSNQPARRTDSGLHVENIVRQGIDTLHALIARNRPKAKIMTDGADWSMRRKAKKLDKLVEGLFQMTGLYKQKVLAFRDRAVFGYDAIEFYKENGHPACERVLPDDIIVDEMECRSAPPQQVARRMFVDKSVLLARYPDKEKEILASGSSLRNRQYTSWRTVPDNLAVVIKAWRLPAPGKRDGRHCVVLDTGTLVDEVYGKDYLPILFGRWGDPLAGFYGHSAIADAAGIQLRLNQLHRFVIKCQDLIAVPRVFVDVGSKTLKIQIDDQIGAVIPYRGKPPVFHTPAAVAAEIYSYMERLAVKGMEAFGVSRMVSQGSRPPPGVESAVAMREYNDTTTDKYTLKAQDYEEGYLDAARILIDIARDCYKGKKVPARWSGRDFLSSVPWEDVDMEADQYFMTVAAASIMSRTPAGRMQQVIEWSQAGLIEDKREARKLMGHPDLEAYQTLEDAALEDIDAAIERVLDGEVESPDGHQDLALGIRKFTLAYLKSRREGAPEEVLDRLRIWIDQAEEFLAPQGPPGPQITAPPPDPAMADPMMAMPGGPAPPVAALAPTAMNIMPSQFPA